MLLTKISINSLLFLILSLCIALFSINYEFLASFRLLDILFIILFIFFVMTNPKVDWKLLLILFFAIAFFSISNMIGTLKNGSIELSKLGFIYKYLFMFAIPWLVVSIVKTKEQIKVINRLLLITFVFLSSWTYIYLSLLASGFISGSFRPSFPLSNDYGYSDAHMYSSYLGFFVVAYLFYLRKFFSHNIIFTSLIVLNGVIGLVLTGSRTGLVLVGLSLFFYGMYSFTKIFFIKNKFKVRRKTIISTVVFLFFVVSLILFMMPYIDDFLKDYERLIERAFSFELTGDQSSLGRIRKLMIGIGDAEYSGYLLGVGFNSSLIWYDGVFAILIAHGGLLFIFSIFVFYYLIIKKAALNYTNQKKFLLFLMMVVLYLIANLITEYIFISRNAFPVLLMLSVLYISILQDKKVRGNIIQ